MVIYEVSLTIDSEIYLEYKSWLKDHITEMLRFPGFIEAKILTDLTDNNIEAKESQSLIVQYLIKDEDHLNNYFNNNANEMRKKGTSIFGNKFSAQRRILNVEDKVIV